jgi:hypothetical protein
VGWSRGSGGGGDGDAGLDIYWHWLHALPAVYRWTP